MTRDLNSEKALKLKQLGVEVVQADQWDVTSLKNAMDGAEAVFGVTPIRFAYHRQLNVSASRSLIFGIPRTLPKARPAKKQWERTW